MSRQRQFVMDGFWSARVRAVSRRVKYAIGKREVDHLWSGITNHFNATLILKKPAMSRHPKRPALCLAVLAINSPKSVFAHANQALVKSAESFRL